MISRNKNQANRGLPANIYYISGFRVEEYRDNEYVRTFEVRSESDEKLFGYIYKDPNLPWANVINCLDTRQSDSEEVPTKILPLNSDSDDESEEPFINFIKCAFGIK